MNTGYPPWDRRLPAYSTVETPQFDLMETHQRIIKKMLKLDIAQLLNLQSRYQNFEMHLKLNLLETKVKSPKIDMSTHYMYNPFGINNRTKVDGELRRR